MKRIRLDYLSDFTNMAKTIKELKNIQNIKKFRKKSAIWLEA